MAGFGGIIGTILGWLGYQVGQRTDAASASGSLHAKAKDVKNAITETRSTLQNEIKNTPQKPRSVRGLSGSFTTSSDTYVTALNLTGRGRILGLIAYTSQTQYPVSGYIKIIVDGINIATAEYVARSGYSYPKNLLFCKSENDAGFTEDGSPYEAQISFKNSIQIQVRKKLNTGLYLYWQYELE